MHKCSKHCFFRFKIQWETELFELKSSFLFCKHIWWWWWFWWYSSALLHIFLHRLLVYLPGVFWNSDFYSSFWAVKKSDLCCYCAATIQHAVASLGTNWFSFKTCGNAGRHCFAQAFLYSCYQICCFFTRTICWILDCFVSASLTPISVKELNKNSSRFTVKILKQTEYAALACKLSNIETKEHQNSQFIQKNHLVNTLKNDKNMLTILTFCYPN